MSRRSWFGGVRIGMVDSVRHGGLGAVRLDMVGCVSVTVRLGGQGKVSYGGLRYVPLWLGGHGSVRYVELGGARSVESRRLRRGMMRHGGSGGARPVESRRSGNGSVRCGRSS